jgi:SET and MYND domain-containing protein 4
LSCKFRSPKITICVSHSTDDMESGTDAEQRCPMVVGGSNPMLPSASNKISIEESMEAGRYVVAASNLEVGDVLVVEKAYASVMRPDKYDTHCHHCYSS